MSMYFYGFATGVTIWVAIWLSWNGLDITAIALLALVGAGNYLVLSDAR